LNSRNTGTRSSPTTFSRSRNAKGRMACRGASFISSTSRRWRGTPSRCA